MANLKEIRGRIRSIKSTQKITKAMKMVATAKLKKTRDSLLSLRDYTHEIEYLITAALIRLKDEDLNEFNLFPLIAKSESENRSHLIILNTTNKGLCGGINNYNFKHLKHRVAELEGRNHRVIIYAIGKKGFDYCINHFPSLLWNKSPIILNETSEDRADKVKNEIASIIEKNKVATSSIIYTKFVNTASQTTKEVSLTPIRTYSTKRKAMDNHQIDYLFDVSYLEMIKRLIPEFMLCEILSAMFENSTSEHAARMIAMENATNNAGKAIKNLTLTYNRIRQANITREISEIVSGVESLKQV
jgi:F-type H+-transporting ATPase subunit gamma